MANDRRSNGGRGTTVITKHASPIVYTSRQSIIGQKNPQTMRYRDEFMSPVSSLRILPIVTIIIRPFLLLCRLAVACFLVHPPPCYKSDKSVCIIERISTCVRLLVSISLARVQTMTTCPNKPSKPGAQRLAMLLCGVIWRSSSRNHCLFVLVMLAPVMFIHVRTYRNSSM